MDDRKILEEVVKRAEGLGPEAIEIARQCSYIEAPRGENGSEMMGTCVFMADRFSIYFKNVYGGQIDKKVSIEYAEMDGVALYKSWGFRQLQIEEESAVLALQIYQEGGLSYDNAMHERALLYLKEKGVKEYEARQRISAGFDNIPCAVPVPNFVITPCL